MQTKSYFSLFLFLFGITFLVSCGSSKRASRSSYGWELLGTRKVDFVRDKDELNVNGNTRYTAIRFHVADRDIHISGLRIIFQNGDKLEPAIDDNVGADQDSRVVELDRDGRLIDKIEFKYRTLGNVLKGRARVFVFGKRYGSDNR